MAEGEQRHALNFRRFGDRVRQARERRGWSQRELARQSGVDIGWVNRVESGERHGISLERAWQLAEALELTLNDLMVDRDSERQAVEVGMSGIVATSTV